MREQSAQRRRRRESPVAASAWVLTVEPVTAFVSLLAMSMLLFAALVWLIHLEATLPEIRNPRAGDASTLMPGHNIAPPGEHSVVEVDLNLRGSWIVQELAGDTWQASLEPDNRMTLAFYGTEIFIVPRLGPEAGIAYVRVDGAPPGHLPQGEHGGIIDLRSTRAADRPVHVVSDLAHGEHVLEITTSDIGEVALSGFIISAQTPFPWVFVLAYTGLLTGLLLVVRALVYQLSTSPNPRESRRQRPADSGSGQ